MGKTKRSLLIAGALWVSACGTSATGTGPSVIPRVEGDAGEETSVSYLAPVALGQLPPVVAPRDAGVLPISDAGPQPDAGAMPAIPVSPGPVPPDTELTEAPGAWCDSIGCSLLSEDSAEYCACDFPVMFQGARDACAAKGARLPRIYSEQQNTELAYLVRQRWGWRNIWLDARSQGEGWYWGEGEPMVYQGAWSKDPDASNLTCLTLGTTSAQWVPLDCTSRAVPGLICER